MSKLCTQYSVFTLYMYVLSSPRQTNNKINELEYLCVKFFSFHSFFFFIKSSWLPVCFPCLLACLFIQERLWHSVAWCVCAFIWWQTNMPTIAQQTHEQLRVTTLISGEAFFHITHILCVCVRLCVGCTCQSSSLSWKHDKVMVKPCFCYCCCYRPKLLSQMWRKRIRKSFRNVYICHVSAVFLVKTHLRNTHALTHKWEASKNERAKFVLEKIAASEKKRLALLLLLLLPLLLLKHTHTHITITYCCGAINKWQPTFSLFLYLLTLARSCCVWMCVCVACK